MLSANGVAVDELPDGFIVTGLGARGVPGTLSNTPPSEPALSNADKPAADAKPADAAAAPLPPGRKTRCASLKNAAGSGT